MNQSTLRLWTGILLIGVAYVTGAAAVVTSPLWTLAAIPIGMVGLGMVTAAVIAIGVRWGMQDVREQRLLFEELAAVDDEE